MPEPTQQVFAHCLDQLMRERGMTNPELGRAIGKHKDTVSRYRRPDAKHGPPSYGIRKDIAEALGLAPHHFEVKTGQEVGKSEIGPPRGSQGPGTGDLGVAWWSGYRAALLQAAEILRGMASGGDVGGGSAGSGAPLGPPSQPRVPSADAALIAGQEKRLADVRRDLTASQRPGRSRKRSNGG